MRCPDLQASDLLRFSKYDDFVSLASAGVEGVEANDLQAVHEGIVTVSIEKIVKSLNGNKDADAKLAQKLYLMCNAVCSADIPGTSIVGSVALKDLSELRQTLDQGDPEKTTDFVSFSQQPDSMESLQRKAKEAYSGILAGTVAQRQFAFLTALAEKMIASKKAGGGKEQTIAMAVSCLDRLKDTSLPWRPRDTEDMQHHMDFIVASIRADGYETNKFLGKFASFMAKINPAVRKMIESMADALCSVLSSNAEDMVDHLRRIVDTKLRAEAPGLASAFTQEDRLKLQGKSEKASTIQLQLESYEGNLALAVAMDAIASQAESILKTMSSRSGSLTHDELGKMLDAYDKMNAAWRRVASE